MSDLPFDFIISDTHFQHRNINKYAWRTTPSFPTPESVDRLMYFNWKAMVGSNDRILHLGDLCKWDQGERIERIADLPGVKTIRRGNHDLYPDEWYEDHGFTVLDEDITFLHHHETAEAIVRLSHYPLDLNPGEVNLHGHVHNNPHRSTPAHLNLSVELTHFAPVRLERALEKVMWHMSKDITSGKNRKKR